MTIIFISLAIGFLIGYKELLNQKLIQLNSRLQTVWMLALIFVMGIGIGRNKKVFEQLPLLGGKSVLFAVVCTIGSILVVYLVSRFFFAEEDVN